MPPAPAGQMSFNFGTPPVSAFNANTYPVAELEAAASALERLRGQLEVTEQMLHHETLGAKIAREAFAAQRLDYKLYRRDNHKLIDSMDEQAYRQIGDLQQENDELRKDNRGQRDQIAALQSDSKEKDHQIQSLESQVAAKKEELSSLQSQLDDTKGKLEDQKTATSNVDTLLTNAYADLNTSNDERKAALRAKDDLDAQLKETELELRDLNKQWQEAQNQLQELQSQVSVAEELERTNAGLNEDIENLREQLETRQRTLIVKDERITHLEDQYQKALQGRLTAEAAINAAASPTEAPQIIAGGESLASELAATSDSSDFGGESTFEQLEFSDITEIANIIPKEPAAAQELTVGVSQAASIAPVEPATTTSSTQTDAPALATEIIHSAAIDIAPITSKTTTSSTQTAQLQVKRVTSTTQTDTPKLSAGIVHTATVNIAPVEPTKAVATTSTQTDATLLTKRTIETSAAQTDVSNPKIAITGTQTLFEAKELDTPHLTVTAATPQKRVGSINTLLAVFAGIFALISLILYARMYAWETASGYRYAYHYGSFDRRRGAFGNGRYLFGIFPIAMDIGPDYWSEQVAAYSSRAIDRFENWLGIAPTPLY